MAGPPPVLRDSRLDLVTLSAMAQTFDQISREDGGQTWPASFVAPVASQSPPAIPDTAIKAPRVSTDPAWLALALMTGVFLAFLPAIGSVSRRKGRQPQTD